MRKVFRARNVFLALVVLIIGWFAEFAYRKNNICGPGDHIILSDADAIETAKGRTFKARYGSHGIPGYLDEKPGSIDFSQANCCSVTRFRTANGVIVWQIFLDGEAIGEPKQRHVGALMELSNCGAVFDEDSFITAEPIR